TGSFKGRKNSEGGGFMTTPMASRGLAAWRRRAAAMLVNPVARISHSTALRTPARTSGAAPVRARHASSPRLSSRTQCSRFSICQCPRAIASNRLAEARSRPKLVTAQTVSTLSWPSVRRTRSIRQTCWAPGQSRYPRSRVVVVSRRISTRPCPLSRDSARSSSPARRSCSRGGKSRAESRPDVRLQRGLVPLDRQEVIPPALDHRLAEIPLGEGGIAGEERPLQGEDLEQLQGRLMLVGPARDAELGDDGLDVQAVGGQQVDAGELMPLGAPQGLAVEGQDPLGQVGDALGHDPPGQGG